MFGTQKPNGILFVLKLVCVVVSLIILCGSYKFMISDSVVNVVTLDTDMSSRKAHDHLVNVVLTENQNKDSVDDKRAAAGTFKMNDTGLDPLFVNLPTEQADRILFKFLRTFTTSCKNKKRFGKAGDGGYWVCMDENVAPRKNDCLVYSFGIRNEWSFDDAIHDQLQCEVHAFDPSMSQADHQRKSKLFFHNLGIWNRNYTNDMGWKLASLQEIKQMLNHTDRVIDYMKIDVEGAEWPMLDEMLTTHSSRNVKQMIFEIHTPKFLGNPMTVKDYSQTYTGLRRLDEELGFKLWVEYHTNGCCGRFATLTSSKVSRGMNICCYELFYINKMIL